VLLSRFGSRYMSIRWRPPATGALRADLRGPLGTFRDQLANPLIARIAPGLLAEASHDGALAEVIYAEAAAPRWAAARAILRGAVDRGELPAGPGTRHRPADRPARRPHADDAGPQRRRVPGNTGQRH